MANQSSTPFDQGLFLVHLNRGRRHFDERNFADAAEELEEARKLRPHDDTVLNLLGLAYFKQEKYREADGVYEKLIELNPESYTLYFNLGLVCFKLGDLDRSEATFLRALEQKPDNQKTHFYLGNIYERKKQYYNAIFQYRKAGANIMVKRVQEKIDEEGHQDQAPGAGASIDADFIAPPSELDDTRPSLARVESDEDSTSPNLDPDLEEINVDHVDPKGVLTAISQGLGARGEAPPRGTDRPEVERRTGTVAGRGGTRRPKASDTQDVDLSPVERKALADGLASSPARKVPPGKADAPKKTRLRLSEPIIQDQTLADMARDKRPANASSELFARTPQRDRRRGDRRRATDMPTAEPLILSSGRERSSDGPQHLRWGGEERSETTNLYQQMRRRDDIFRYLENNLMEVNFSGKVFIKQGTIYSYSGNLTFWVKPPREEQVPPLVIVSGTGKLLLTDRQRDITVIQIEDEEIFVEPSHLLACQETLTPRYAVIEKEGSRSGLSVLLIQGSGMLALSVATSPLLLTVQKQYPVNVSSNSIISWSGDLKPTIVEDEALAELMMPGTKPGLNLRLEGEGRVMMEKSS